MEATKSANKIKNSQTPERKDTERLMEQVDGQPSPVSGSRRTRSQVAPDWTVKDALILVNEFAAVEADCLKALSTYQKWKIIAENCTALEVSRTLNQCRRKWDSLLAEYNKIKRWELQSRSDSYWSLERIRRIEFGLPENFEDELFNAIDNVVRAQENQSDTDPDTDAEAEPDMLEVIAELGSKSQRRRLMLNKNCGEEKQKPEKTHAEEKPQISCAEEKPQKSHAEEKLQQSRAEEKPQESHGLEKSQKSCLDKTKTLSIEEKEQMMAAKLRESAELIHAIAKGNLNRNADNGAADSKNNENFQTDFVRRQGDELIACFGDIVSTLNQFCDLVQEYE